MALHPCTACGRHVRHHEKHCPFCNAALVAMNADLSPVLRVSRAAMWLGAALSVGACDKPNESSTLPVNATPVNTPQPSTQPNTQVLPTTVNNAPQPVGQQQLFPQPQLVPQESPQQQIVGQPTPPEPNAVPAYGGPPPVRPQDTIGSTAARYGIAPPPQGPNDPGSHARRYGAPALVEWDEV
jgi:hypothetical protein